MPSPIRPLPTLSGANATTSVTHATRSSSPRPAATDGKTRDFDIDSTIAYQVDGPSEFLLQVHALDARDQQVLSESLTISPAVPLHVFADPAEQHRVTRFRVESGAVEVRYRARVRRSVPRLDRKAAEWPIAELPDNVLHYLVPTRYCESDLLSRAAQKQFGHLSPGFGRVEAVCDWIHENIEYRIGTSTSTTTAADVFLQRAGVCRDFAHLGITFCRALNMPARLVAGYAPFDEPPPDFHAVFEVFLGGQWVMFDATRMSPLDQLVRIASGRDAKDVAFATLYGPATMTRLEPLIAPASASVAA